MSDTIHFLKVDSTSKNGLDSSSPFSSFESVQCDFQRFMVQRPELMNATFLGEWTDAMSEQLRTGMNKINLESDVKSDVIHVCEWDEEIIDETEDEEIIDEAEDDGIIDDAEDFHQYGYCCEVHPANYIEQNADNHHNDYDISFDPHFNW